MKNRTLSLLVVLVLVLIVVGISVFSYMYYTSRFLRHEQTRVIRLQRFATDDEEVEYASYEDTNESTTPDDTWS